MVLSKPSNKIRRRLGAAASRLLDLPPELRNRVYGFVFAGSTTGIFSVGPSLWSFIHVDNIGNKIFKLPSIFRVNRQIRSEALALFHACTEWLVCMAEVPGLLLGLGTERLAMVSKMKAVVYVPTDAVTYAHSLPAQQGKWDCWAFDGIEGLKKELEKRDLSIGDGVLSVEVRGIDEKVVWTWDWSQEERSPAFWFGV